jgi:acylphosphatase
MADELGVVGFARNQDDGSVYIEAEGNMEALQAFIEWCHTGPEYAEVAGVAIKKLELKWFSSFEILH